LTDLKNGKFKRTQVTEAAEGDDGKKQKIELMAYNKMENKGKIV